LFDVTLPNDKYKCSLSYVELVSETTHAANVRGNRQTYCPNSGATIH